MAELQEDLLSCSNLGDKCCTYTTVKNISVHDPKLSITYYLVIILSLSYVVIYTIILQKGYQTFDDVVGYSSTKIKGTGSTCDDNNNCTVYDAMDLVYMPNELNSVFITTSMTITYNQTQQTCNGNDDVPDCFNATACTKNQFDPYSQGIYTGNCASNNKCEIFGWCPLENDSDILYINNIENFTIFVQINVRYPALNKRSTNLINHEGETKPTYGLSLFSIKQILNNADQLTIDDVAKSGAIIGIDVAWNCDFDYDTKECDPEFSFYRLDGQSDDAKTITKGLNFRTAYYDFNGNEMQRTLQKLHGLRIIFIISGSGGQFDWVALSITFGAGLTFLGIASVITDMVLSQCLPESMIYSQRQTETLDPKYVKIQNDSLRWLSFDHSAINAYDYQLMDE